MKKHILLTTTAILLSVMAMNANADSNSARLNMEVTIREPFDIREVVPLGFGIVLASGPGKTVIVTPDGELDPKSTATMMSKSGYDSGIHLIGSPLGEGRLMINNSLFKNAENEDEDTLNAAVSLVGLKGASVDMTSLDSEYCGTVSDFTTRFKRSTAGDVILHIGGTFTTSEISGNVSCRGETTVTIVLNDEYWQSIWQ